LNCGNVVDLFICMREWNGDMNVCGFAVNFGGGFRFGKCRIRKRQGVPLISRGRKGLGSSYFHSVIYATRNFSVMKSQKEVHGMEVVEVPSQLPATSSLVFLHGLGDTAHGWSDSFEEMNLTRTRVVLPTANQLPITVNGGMRMPAWFDIYEFPIDDPENVRDDVDGLANSVSVVRKLVQREINQYGISPDQVYVGGFSQGGAVAYSYALQVDPDQAPVALAGVLGLSTWLPMKNLYQQKSPCLSKSTKFSAFHGSYDPVVQTSFGKMSADMIRGLGYEVDFHTYNMAHSAHPDELRSIRSLLES